MRYLGLLFALALVSSPAQARKHAKHPAPVHQTAAVEETPPPAVEAPPPARAPAAQVAQANDDEVPGKRHRK